MQPKDSFHLKIGIHVAVLSGVIMAGLLIPVPSSWQVSAQAFQRAAQGYSVKVDDARSTTKTLSGKSKAQIVEATIENNGTGWFTPSHPARVTVQADGVQTTVPAKITELRPRRADHCGSWHQKEVVIDIRWHSSQWYSCRPCHRRQYRPLRLQTHGWHSPVHGHRCLALSARSSRLVRQCQVWDLYPLGRLLRPCLGTCWWGLCRVVLESYE